LTDDLQNARNNPRKPSFNNRREEIPMESELARNWWLVALRGMLAIAFGILAFLWPGFLWLTVVYLFAVYALLDGGMAIASVIRNGDAAQHRLALLFEGVVGIAAGILAVAWPGITELALLYLIAGWSVATGIFEIVAAVRLRKIIKGEWLLALGGILSIAFGVMVALMPLAGLLVIAWWAAGFWIAFGALLLALAFRLRFQAGVGLESSATRGQHRTPGSAGGASPQPGG
jgi:uncharacterized membrane protein HdeD (DUF308 family)